MDNLTFRIFNTLSGQKESFEISAGKTVNIFVCGPTVYDYSHIGHARTYLAFDIIVRYLRQQGVNVFYLQNITDVDDKIIQRANESGKDPLELALFFTDAYRQDLQALDMNAVDAYAPATQFIPQILAQVQRLIEKGFAYKIEDDGYYFDISKFKDYGKLSGRTVEQAEDAVSRIDSCAKKRNKGDFCLWKFSKAGEPNWESPLGNGRPGWHIEDTAISENYFGPQYDIHGGAVELKFPHHEAEIAQQEAASGKTPFVRFWMHTGVLFIDGKKMSKSLGNFITIREFLEKYPAHVLRWIVLKHHYRSPINYNQALAEEAISSLERIREFLIKLDFVAKKNIEGSQAFDAQKRVAQAQDEFHEIMSDDFNTPAALAHIFQFCLEFQEKAWNLNSSEAEILHMYIVSTLKTLGLTLPPNEIPKDIEKMVKERDEHRRNKQFVKSDELRKIIEGLGYTLEDTPHGPLMYRKR